MSESCETCRYFGKTLRLCRIRAPSVWIVAFNPTTKEATPVSTFPQPPLGKEDWCGEWVPKDVGKLN